MAGFGITKAVFFSVMVMATLEMAMSVVYNVGDEHGWTIGAVDYKEWSSTKKFSVGDIVVFRYKNTLHNLVQVIPEAYDSCNKFALPIAFYNSGETKISVEKTGHYYFISSVGQDCTSGMKVDIDVTP